MSLCVVICKLDCRSHAKTFDSLITLARKWTGSC